MWIILITIKIFATDKASDLKRISAHAVEPDAVFAPEVHDP
jgi:hypothetical protein